MGGRKVVSAPFLLVDPFRLPAKVQRKHSNGMGRRSCHWTAHAARGSCGHFAEPALSHYAKEIWKRRRSEKLHRRMQGAIPVVLRMPVINSEPLKSELHMTFQCPGR